MIQDKLESFIENYLTDNGYSISNWNVSSNSREGFGDYSSNIALILSKKVGKNPMEIAEDIVASHKIESSLFSLTATKPGFVNFHIKLMNAFAKGGRGEENPPPSQEAIQAHTQAQGSFSLCICI